MKQNIRFNIIHLIVATLFFSLTALGQGELLSFVDSNGVYLRWLPVIEPNLEGYNVYRSQNDGPWEKVNPNLLKRLEDNSELDELLGYQKDLFLGLFGLQSIDDNVSEEAYLSAFSDEESSSLIGALSLVNPKFGEALGLMYLDENSNGGKVQYKISAIRDGKESDIGLSSKLNSSVPHSIPSPIRLSGEPSDEVATLSWKKHLMEMDLGEVISYNVYRSNALLGPYQRINYTGILPIQVSSGKLQTNKEIQSYVDRYLKNGTAYYYKVKSVNAFGIESASSITVKVVPSDVNVSKPYGLKAALFGTNLQLSWKNNGKPKGYKVYKSNNRDKGFEAVYPRADFLLNNETSWLDVNVEPGGIYYYFVEAVGLKDEHSVASDTLSYAYIDMSPPLAPIGVEAKVIDGTVRISWKPNEAKNIIGYDVARSSNYRLKEYFTLNGERIKGTEYVDDLYDDSERHFGYVVYAVSSAGLKSVASEMVKAKLPDHVAPGTPFINYLNQNGDSLLLKWTPRREDDLQHYNVYRSDRAEEGMTLVKGVGAPYCYDRPSKDGIYYYSVSAVDSSNNESPLSSTISASFVRDVIPYPPASGSVRNEEGKLIIAWKASPTHSIEGYMILRYDKDKSNATFIREITSKTLQIKDMYAKASKMYFYHIIAIDARGVESEPLELIWQPDKE